MYIFLRTCSLRRFTCNNLVKSHRCNHQICYTYIPNKTTVRKYTKLSHQINTFSSVRNKCTTFDTLTAVTAVNVNDNKLLRPDNQIVVIARPFSLSSYRNDKEPLKPSSKVEVTVNALKDEQKKKEALPAESSTKAVVKKKSLKQKIIDECMHYYHGFRLLFIDIRISGGLAFRILQGKTLTRREHMLLVRTVGDIFRLVPFSVFIIVPFLEFTLPFFLKFFPGMLPSQFETGQEREDKLKKSLKVKLEMAKFLQKTLDEMALQHKDRNSQSAKEFSEWFHKVRTSGEEISNEDIMKFSKLFQDEITLDSLSRGQLVALCRVLEVQTLGTNNLLRFQLRMKLRSLAADDKLIQKEGVDSLTVTELQNACKARGMRAYGLSEEALRKQLGKWLDLSLNKKVPPSLLLLSRALMLPDTIPTSDKLKATISVLPDTIVAHTKAAIGESEGKIDNKVKAQVIAEEARKIKEEREEERKRKAEEICDKAPIMEASATQELKDPAKTQTIEKPQICTADLEVLEDALEDVAKNKKRLIIEKECIEDLKEEMADYQEDVQELEEVTSCAPKKEVKESKAAKRLFNRVNKMIQKMDTIVGELESCKAQQKKEAANITEEEIVRIDELLTAIKRIQKVPDDSVLQQIKNILGKMDDDRDGSIKVEDVLKVIEVIGKENVQLSPKQVDELIELIDKEEILEVEDKIEKALQKEAEKKGAHAKSGGNGKDVDKSCGNGDKPSPSGPSSSDSKQNQPKSCSAGEKDKPKPKIDAQPATGITTPPPISIDQVNKKDSSSKML